MTDLDEDDLYDVAPATMKYGLREDGKRYDFPPPPGVPRPKPYRGWKRMTNHVSAFSDQRALQLWLEWRTMRGLLANEGLIFDEMAAVDLSRMDEETERETLKSFAELARTADGADAGARRGTARHTMLEHYQETGEIIGHRRMKLQMESFLEALEANELDLIPGWSERTVWNSIGGGVVGRMDGRVMCRRTGQEGIIDLKTLAHFWTYQEACGQQAGYDSAEWVWEGPLDDTGRWVPNARNTLMGHPEGEFADRRVALLAHMPKDPGPDQLPVRIVEVDLVYGRQVLEVAARNEELRSIGRSVAIGRRTGAVRPPSA